MKAEIAKNELIIRVIVCGGDGTVMWVIHELLDHQIDVNNCPIGIIPFGTGNDLSIVLGWGQTTSAGELLGEHFKALKAMMLEWINAPIQDLDIWDVQIDMYEGGGMYKVKRQGGVITKETFVGGQPGVPAVHKQMLSNYLSIGIDARIGFGFDKSRSNSRWWNKVVYCWEGFKKMFTSTTRVNDLVANMDVIDEEAMAESLQQSKAFRMNLNRARKHSIFISGKSVKDGATPINSPKNQLPDAKKPDTFAGMVRDVESPPPTALPQEKLPATKTLGQSNTIDDKKDAIKLDGNPACIVALNINSYMGGCDPWSNCAGKIAISGSQGELIRDQFTQQNFGDGKMEFVCYSSPLALGAERMLPGQAKRVAQGNGPYVINFNKVDMQGRPITTYINIDGEYYQLKSPQSITLYPTRKLKNGKVKVLVKRHSANANKQ